MKWVAFKGLTVGEIADVVQVWEAGGDEDGAREFVADVLDNAIFKFEEGSVMENMTDGLIAMGVPQIWQTVASRLGRLASGVLDAKPLASLPF